MLLGLVGKCPKQENEKISIKMGRVEWRRLRTSIKERYGMGEQAGIYNANGREEASSSSSKATAGSVMAWSSSAGL